MNEYMMGTLYLLIPFTIYGLVTFSKWWFRTIHKNPKGKIIILIFPTLITWTLYSLIVFTNQGLPKELIPIYCMWTVFGPISFAYLIFKQVSFIESGKVQVVS